MARSSRRGHRRGKSGESAAWKKSKAVAIILVVVIVGALVNMIRTFTSTNSTGLLPDNFPHTFITESGAGNDESKVIVKRSSRQPVTPFKEGSEWAWPAYYCMNEVCPGRKDGKPYIFPAIDPMALAQAEGKKVDPAGPDAIPPMMELNCPMCQKLYNAAKSNADKEKYMPMNIDKYQTEEGKKIFEEIRKKLQAMQR